MSDVHVTWQGGTWLAPLALVALAFGALILWTYRSASVERGVRMIAAACKYLGVLLLIVCLLEPRMHGQRPTQGANSVAILIDNSRSMQLEGRGVPAGREISEWLGTPDSGWRKRLAEEFDVHLFAFDRDLRSITDSQSLDFGGEFSNLHSAVAALQKQTLDRPLAGIVLVSDGNATDGAESTGTATDWPVPIYPVVRFEASELRDLRLHQTTVTQTPFESSPVTVQAEVVSQGADLPTVIAQLIDPEGKVVEEQELSNVKQDVPTPIQFRLRTKEAGTFFYRLRIGTYRPIGAEWVTSQGEATLENNQRTILVDRAGGPFRILYVAGRPNWEFKFLRRAMDEDTEVQLDGLLRIANKQPKFVFNDRRQADGSNLLFEGFDKEDPDDVAAHDEPVFKRILANELSKELSGGFPETAVDLYAYHGIILDDVEAAFFSPDQQELVRQAVSQRGAGLLMLGGIQSFAQGGYARTPIGEMLPVYLSASDATTISSQETDRRWSLTREGWLEPWVRLRSTEQEEVRRLQQMPAFQVVNPTGPVKPGAAWLAQLEADATTSVGLAVQRFGKGRVGAITVGDLWRWELQRAEPESAELTVFWRQMLRWLIAESPQRVELSVKPSSSGTEPVRISVQTRAADFLADDEATLQLTVTGPDGQSLKIHATPDDERSGLFHAEYWPQQPGGHRVSAQVASGSGETLPLRTTGWVVAPAEKEWDRLDAQQDWLKELARLSGGVTADPDKMASVVAQIQARPAPVMESWSAPWWHRPWIFLGAVVCFCVEWALRRYRGLA